MVKNKGIQKNGKSVVLITGATGYIGGRLMTVVDRSKYKIRCFVRNPDYIQKNSIEGGEIVQGDILDLESIDRKFDIIESVGVLHHMDNPFKGWKILTSCLNNDSLMLI